MMRLIPLLVAVTFLGSTQSAAAAEYNTGPLAMIQCPAKGKATTASFDLSTGIAPWVVEGPGLPNGGKARATPVDEASLPAGWAARLPGAGWVQAMPVTQAAAHDSGEFVYTLSFVVKKAKRMPRLSLTGDVAADEAFDLTLIEPAAANEHISSGIAYGDDSPGAVAQDDVQPLALNKSGGLNGKPLGHRAGTYRLEIRVANTAVMSGQSGLLAKLQLVARCGGVK